MHPFNLKQSGVMKARGFAPWLTLSALILMSLLQGCSQGELSLLVNDIKHHYLSGTLASLKQELQEDGAAAAHKNAPGAVSPSDAGQALEGPATAPKAE